VVLVVLERPSELFLHHFWLITNWTPEQQGAAAMPESAPRARCRGGAHGRADERAAAGALLVAAHPEPLPRLGTEERPASEDSFERNEVLLLLNVLAYNVMHATRTLLETATGEDGASSASASEFSACPLASSSTRGGSGNPS
jgi:hypothetical protein